MEEEGERDEGGGGDDANVEGEDIVAEASSCGGFEAGVGTNGGEHRRNHGSEWHQFFVKQLPPHFSDLCPIITE
uniref:Uncharacterized protein n=1 Tax=Cucumis sativus TaxID=3659 RepID=A0A0A0LCX4_CUCSA